MPVVEMGQSSKGPRQTQRGPFVSPHDEHNGGEHDHEKDDEHEDQRAPGVVRHVARIARVFSFASHGCTGGVTAGIMPVWYAAIDTPGSGTNCGVGGATGAFVVTVSGVPA